MIYNYEIQEDILYIYLDFDDEFAKLNWREKKQKLEDNIKNFIKENKINFKGTKIAIVVGGVVLGTLLLGNSNEISEPSKVVNNNILISTNILDTKPESIVEKKEDALVNESRNENQTTNNQIENKDEQVTIIQKEESKEQIPTNETINVNQNLTNGVTNQNQAPNQEEIKQDNSVEMNNDQIEEQPNDIIEDTKEDISNEAQIEEQKTYVTIHRTNGQIINLELEEYLIGVVGAEMPASFNEQALMSQAIIARTYALKAIQRGTRLTDNSSTQNYKSNEELRGEWGSSYEFYYSKIKSAVDSTKGLYLTYNGSIIDAVYHSTSNGKTEDASYVWGNAFPYLISVESNYDTSNPSFIKEQFISYEELTTKLGVNIDVNTSFDILSRTPGNRILTIKIDETIYTGIQIRTKLGLRSADFEIQKNDTGIIFVTKGYGHGVGLSQYGANGMAKAGYNYIQILKHYYQGVQINQM